MQKLIDDLSPVLKSAVTEHYRQIADSHDDVYGYALCTVDTVECIFPYANAESSLSETGDEQMDALNRFLAVQWKLTEGHDLFNEANQILQEINAAYLAELGSTDSVEQRLAIDSPRESVLSVCFEVLKQLESDGLFGPRSDTRFVSLFIADSEDKLMCQAAREFNSPAVAAQACAVLPCGPSWQE